MKQTEVLQTVEWAEDMFGSLVTSTQCSRRDVMRAVKAGLVESVGMVVISDDDGFAIEPERYKEGFKLTADGRSRLDS